MKKKTLWRVLIAVAVLWIGGGMLARGALAAGVRAVTGMRLETQKVDLGLFRTKMEIRGLKLLNPPGFHDRVLADLPEMVVDYDLAAFFRGKTHLERLSLELKELVVVRNAKGELNLDSLTSVQRAKAGKKTAGGKVKPAGKPRALQIDLLQMKIGKVVYKDYSQGAQPSVREFQVNLNEEYRNITDPTVLGALIVTRALVQTTLSGLLQLDLSDVERMTSGLLDAAGGAADEAKKTLKKILPISE